MNKNEKMQINFCALIVLLLVLTGYTLIFSDIWVNAKEGVAIGSHYQKFYKQQKGQVYPDLRNDASIKRHRIWPLIGWNDLQGIFSQLLGLKKAGIHHLLIFQGSSVPGFDVKHPAISK